MDCLPLAKSKLQSAIRRSAAFWKPDWGGRSLAVFSEGVDSGPSDPGKAPEACEIGGTSMPSGRAHEARLTGPKGDARGRRTIDAVVTNSGPVRFIAAGAVCPPVGRMPDSYLVDPASSHMLVSKIKPCMSKYKQIYTVKLRMAH